MKAEPKLPTSLFDSYAVWIKVWEQHPMTKIKPPQVADVLDAVVAIERARKRTTAKQWSQHAKD